MEVISVHFLKNYPKEIKEHSSITKSYPMQPHYHKTRHRFLLSSWYILLRFIKARLYFLHPWPNKFQQSLNPSFITVSYSPIIFPPGIWLYLFRLVYMVMNMVLLFSKCALTPLSIFHWWRCYILFVFLLFQFLLFFGKHSISISCLMRLSMISRNVSHSFPKSTPFGFCNNSRIRPFFLLYSVPKRYIIIRN